MTDLNRAAEIVDTAALRAQAIAQFSEDTPLSIEDAYTVQRLSMERRYARGERRVGVKMGFTSRAKMQQMGLSDLIWGRLTSGMREEEGSTIHLARYVHPRAEPEVAYLLRAPLTGIVTPAEAMAAVEAVAPAMEIIDSRYANFQFDLGDVIADNSSSSGFVLGRWHAPDTDVRNLGLVVTVDAETVQIGSTAAILGDPVRALVAAARVASAAEEPLQAGDIVLAGGATAATALAVGQAVRTEFQHLGSVGFRVGE